MVKVGELEALGLPVVVAEVSGTREKTLEVLELGLALVTD